MDNYLAVISAWASLLRTITTYFPETWQVSIADDSILGRGANFLAVLNVGSFPKTDISAQDARIDWQIYTDVYARYVNEADTSVGLSALRSEVIAVHLHNRDDLGADVGVMGSSLDASNQVQYVMSAGQPNSGPVFKTQRLILVANQYVDQTV
jgi:hypothetical protein